MDGQELPRYLGPVDHLRTGFRSLENEFSAPHPVASIQKGDAEAKWLHKLQIARTVHGSGFAMRLATERSILSKKGRMTGLPSSSFLLETVTGNDTSINFEDYLNDPLLRPEIPKVQLHERMEVQYGIL